MGAPSRTKKTTKKKATEGELLDANGVPIPSKEDADQAKFHANAQIITAYQAGLQAEVKAFQDEINNRAMPANVQQAVDENQALNKVQFEKLGEQFMEWLQNQPMDVVGGIYSDCIQKGVLTNSQNK